MYCRKCGQPLPQNTRFCTRCGTEILRQRAPSGQGAAVGQTPGRGDVTLRAKNFCVKCGGPLDDRGRCTVCGASAGPAGRKKGKGLLVTVMVLLSLYVAALIAVGALVYFDKLDIPFINDILISMEWKEPAVREAEAPEAAEAPAAVEDVSSSDLPEETVLTDRYRVTPPDAEAYYSENATVLLVLDAEAADTVLSESEVYELLTERGFVDYDITTDYYITGEFNDDMIVSEYSSERHPLYQTYYMTPDGDLWRILVVNASIYASPVFRNAQPETEVPVIVSETDRITSYDATTNQFFVNVPNETVMRIRTAARIDSAALDDLAERGVD